MTKKKTATNKNQETLVTLLLDRSSSMSSCYDATIEAFNGYISTLKDAKTPIKFTFLQFDHHAGCDINKVHFEMPIKDVPDLNKTSYKPRGSTPLIEASIKTIEALDKALSAKENNPKVVICIQTDGEENSSNHEYTWDRLSSLVQSKTKEGWQFNFMGAGIDAYDQGSKMGMSVAQTMSYDHNNLAATRSAFAANAANTMAYASGEAVNTAYSAKQKLDAGDIWDPLNQSKRANNIQGNLSSTPIVPFNGFPVVGLPVAGGFVPVTTTAVPLDLSNEGTVVDNSLDLTQ